VPVLSKHIAVIFPKEFTLGGEIQNIFFYFRRDNAIEIPTYKEVVKAGGTAMVINSNPSITISEIDISPYLHASIYLVE